jgi:hypothetical protein
LHGWRNCPSLLTSGHQIHLQKKSKNYISILLINQFGHGCMNITIGKYNYYGDAKDWNKLWFWCIHIYICKYMYMYIYTHTYIYEDIYTCMYIYNIWIFMHTYMHTYIHFNVFIDIHFIHMYIYINTYIYTYLPLFRTWCFLSFWLWSLKQ